MILRVRLEIVPFGEESNSYEIMYAEISSIGEVRDEGFGHVYCKYKYRIMKPIPPVLQEPNGPTHKEYASGEIPEHDRRDGPWVLTQKVIEDFERESDDPN